MKYILVPILLVGVIVYGCVFIVDIRIIIDEIKETKKVEKVTIIFTIITLILLLILIFGLFKAL